MSIIRLLRLKFKFKLRLKLRLKLRFIKLNKGMDIYINNSVIKALLFSLISKSKDKIRVKLFNLFNKFSLLKLLA